MVGGKMETESITSRGAYLSVPDAPRVSYPNNTLKQVVCELRFPTLFDFDAERPPVSLAKALRKDYPVHGRTQDVKITDQGMGRAQAHLFRSRDSRWAIMLRPASLTVETSKYTNFEELERRVAQLIDVAGDVIDSDFFTRIGLRYINSLPFERTEIDQWVNPDLVKPLAAGVFGDVMEYAQRVNGSLRDGGGYLLQHGVGVEEGTGITRYAIDLDFYQEDVEVGDAPSVIRRLHKAEYSLFAWTLGEKARQMLRDDAPKNGRG